jgi:hypothetical protein
MNKLGKGGYVILVLFCLILFLAGCTSYFGGNLFGQAIYTKSGRMCMENWNYLYNDKEGSQISKGIKGCTYLNDDNQWCATKTINLKNAYFSGKQYGTNWKWCKNSKGEFDKTATYGCAGGSWEYYQADGKTITQHGGCTDQGEKKGEYWCPTKTITLNNVYLSGGRYGTVFEYCKPPEMSESVIIDDSSKPPVGLDIKEDNKGSDDVASCFKNNCYDSDLTELYPQKVKGYTYKKRAATRKDIQDGIPTMILDGTTYSCVKKDDYCKDNSVVEQTCAPNPTVISCECGCVDGACAECKYPDLYIKEIYPKVLSKECTNSFYFNICNKGNAEVGKPFKVVMISNNVEKEYELDTEKIKSLSPGKCMDIIVPGLFSVGSFGHKLGQTVDVKAVIDKAGTVGETVTSNNEITQKVFTGDAYYYDEKTKCDTFCYETDAGEDYNTYGEITYSYAGAITSSSEGYKTGVVDMCYGLNGHDLTEIFCKLPITMKTNGKFSYPKGVFNYDCLKSNPPKKCEDGACVPLKVLCEDAYGKKIPCLNCIDNEGLDPKLKEYNYAIPWDNKYYELINPFVVGTIEKTNLDNVKEKKNDFCEDTEMLSDYYCDNNYKYSEEGLLRFNCYRMKNQEGKGHFCKDGTCVITDIDYEKCEGPTKTDPFKHETVKETKLLGEKIEFQDWCINEDKLKEFYCKGKYAEEMITNCDSLVDSNGKSATCVNGVCAFLDESKMKCVDYDDGFNPKQSSWVEYVTGYGFSGVKQDMCENSETLNEAYCEGKTLKFSSVSCKEKGGICSKGACLDLSKNNFVCKDNYDNGEDANVPGFTTLVSTSLNEYGKNDVIDSHYDECIEDNFVKEWYCENNLPISKKISCKEMGKACKAGACYAPDPNKKDCKEIEMEKLDGSGKEKFIVMRTEYGIIDEVRTPSCDYSGGFIWVSSCNSKKELEKKKVYCPAGTSCFAGECLSYKEPFKGCREYSYPPSSSYQMTIVENFVEENYDVDFCWDSKTLFKFFCTENSYKSKQVSCFDSGKVCYHGTCRLQGEIDSYKKPYCLPDIYDNGKDPSVKGIILTYDENELFDFDADEDECYDENKLFENYCDAGILKTEEISCKDLGKKCVKGACI